MSSLNLPGTALCRYSATIYCKPMSQVIAQPGVNVFSSTMGSLIPSFWTKALLKSRRIMADA